MSQARAIENDNVLRLLPLPGRGEGALQDRSRADKAAERGLAETRNTAAQSQQPEGVFSVKFGTQNAFSQTTVNATRQNQRGSQTGNGLNLSDEVVSFLLTGNEVSAGDEADPNDSLRIYQEATAAFPRSKPSLFSLAV